MKRRGLALPVLFPLAWLLAYALTYLLAFHIYQPQNFHRETGGLLVTRYSESYPMRVCRSSWQYILWRPAGWLETKLRTEPFAFVLKDDGPEWPWFDPDSASVF